MNVLPTIKELYTNEIAEKQDTFVALLNQEPKSEWIAEHPYIKQEVVVDGVKMRVPYKYIPINRVEFLLKSIFKRYRIEITGQGTSFNGVYVTVRVHYVNPITGEWDYHDGIGASQLQTSKGSSPADLGNINNGALSMAFPLAKTLAIKDACDHFGKLFGSDLNRKDEIVYADPLTLTPFERGHVKWGKAVEAIAKKRLTIADAKKYYNITSLGEQQLEEDILDYKIENNL